VPNVWDADVELPLDRACALIASQFPDLVPVSAELLGQGWDNIALLVNQEFVFRFPRRKLAGTLIEAECLCLPAIHTRVAVPIPMPIFPGQPDGGYPYSFAGYRQIEGVPACRRAWTDVERASFAEPLAIFLRELHGIPIDPEMKAPCDTLKRADIRMRLPKDIERAKRLSRLLASNGFEADAVVAALEALDGTPQEFDRVWVHGDFYPCHFLVDPEGGLSGVIDWGDVHLGDRAIDLSIAFTFLPPEARGTFWAAYGSPAEEIQRRARFRALHYGVVLLEYTTDVSDATLQETARYALRSALNQ
jgi:aminoglycoside phosphotransferase (APT) family kinase protein